MYQRLVERMVSKWLLLFVTDLLSWQLRAPFDCKQLWHHLSEAIS